jgi:hypothetical protein
MPRQSGFQVEDLMLEVCLDHPILQLAAGKFQSYAITLKSSSHWAW